MIVYQFAARWLRVTRRQLVFKAAMDKRAGAESAKADVGSKGRSGIEIEEPELSLDELSEDTHQLIPIGMLATTAIASGPRLFVTRLGGSECRETGWNEGPISRGPRRECLVIQIDCVDFLAATIGETPVLVRISSQRGNQIRSNDAVVMGKQGGAQDLGGSDDDAIARVAVKGVGEGADAGGHSRRDTDAANQRRRNGGFEPVAQRMSQLNSSQTIQCRDFPETNVGHAKRFSSVGGLNDLRLAF